MSSSLPKALQASKWLQLPALLDAAEMESLLDELGDFSMYSVGSVRDRGRSVLHRAEFLKDYHEYMRLLKEGRIPDSTVFRSSFAVVWTLEPDAVALMVLSGSQELARVVKPVVQLQLHVIGYSTLEKKFRSNVMGKDSIHWGVQFSFPQLYMDPETSSIEKALNSTQCPNALLFKKIQKWIRDSTLPTPFEVEGMKIQVPMRIGKQCFSWIHRHAQLQQFGIKVFGQSEESS